MSQKNKNEDIWKDPRFSHLTSDPRFKNLPKSKRKVKIDKRFQSMFDDGKFKIKYSVDKYGRSVNKSSSDELKKYYDIDSADDDSDDDDDEKIKIEQKKEEEQILKDANDDLENDGETLDNQVREKLLKSDVDFARGEGRILTDSSSDEVSSDEDDEFFIEHVWGELDTDAATTSESTYRIAACNMDWDRIRASDIFVLCKSFLPPAGLILSVKIYLSEYGKSRIQEEELHGPPELVRNEEKYESVDDNAQEDSNYDNDSDAEEGEDYHMEKLRQYQLNRLKYYYAVIECDSVETADKLYKECDGLEYESTATKLDLRFIPNEETFNDIDIKDSCLESPDLAKYKPRLFTTTALQQAKVELTWDETNVERKEMNDKISAGKLDEISEADLRKYVAYSSSSEEDSDENKQSDYLEEQKNGPTSEKDSISKYKLLLNEINKKEEDKQKSKFEMEYTWGIDVKTSKSDSMLEAHTMKKNLTPIEKILEKRKEKNKKRKNDRKKKLLGPDNDGDNSDSDLPDGIDLNDPYFAEEFENNKFKKNKTKDNKNKKNKTLSNEADDNDKSVVNLDELELLIDNDEEIGKSHFTLEKILKTENETKSHKRRKKKLRKSKKEIDSNKNENEVDDFKVNTKDERFKRIYESHLFNIDPSDSHFKKTKGMEEIIKEKLNKRNITKNQDFEQRTDAKKSKKEIENVMLIKSLKRKIKEKKF